MSFTATLSNDVATLRDSLGRAFDATRFRPAFDKIGRWINAKAGRKPGKNAKKARTRPLPMSTDSNASENATTAEATAPAIAAAPPTAETPAPASAPAQTASADSAPTAAAAPAKPDFSDIERAAGPAVAKAQDDGAAGVSAEAGETDALGLTTADSVIGIIQTALVLIGDDEGILTRAEKMALRPPLERVLKKYNVGADALPAEIDLAVALALIVVARLQKPKTATFFAKVRAWLGGKVMEAKGRALAASVREANQ